TRRSRAQGSASSRWLSATGTGGANSIGEKTKATGRWPLMGSRSSSVCLLDARKQPAGRAVERLGEIPDFLEALGGGRRMLADHSREPHARPVLGALGHHLEQVGIERYHVGLLLRPAALGDILLQFAEELRRREFTQLLDIAGVVRELKLHEVQLRGAYETGYVEAGRQVGTDCRDCLRLEARQLGRRRRGNGLVAECSVARALRPAG